MTKTRHLLLVSTLLLFASFSSDTYARPATIPDVAGKQASANKEVIIRQESNGGTLAGPGHIAKPVIAAAPATSSGNVMIDGCDSGVVDIGGIQAGVDMCVANATNHGKLVSCITHYTKTLERNGSITKSGRKAIKLCAAHSDIGKGNNSTGDN